MHPKLTHVINAAVSIRRLSKLIPTIERLASEAELAIRADALREAAEMADERAEDYRRQAKTASDSRDIERCARCAAAAYALAAFARQQLREPADSIEKADSKGSGLSDDS